MAKNAREVIGGVDTHADAHAVVVIDLQGRVVGSSEFGSDAAGCAQLLAWVRRQGRVQAIGVEGTGSYGAGLARLLTAAQIAVVEVNRPDRTARRARGKSDLVDAEAAARAVLSGAAGAIPKLRTGPVEAIRVLRVVRCGAVKARTAALNALLGLARTAVEPVGSALHAMTARQVVAHLLAAGANRPAGTPAPLDAAVATSTALGRLAARVHLLDQEIAATDSELRALTRHVAPRLLDLPGVGPDVAGQLLTTAGDNPRRLANDSSFARLTGVAPLAASSGRTTRHRLSRGGDRQANRALHTVVLTRMRHDPRTRDYVARRTTEGLSKREIMRCLKRYVAREVFPLITEALDPTNQDRTPRNAHPRAA